MVDDGWPQALAAAVNADNEEPSMACTSSLTYRLLCDAPPVFRPHADLVLADFQAAGSLGDLRSDTVARQFRVSVEMPNMLAGRMTVPGGPWPGHFGLESITFDAEPARFPDWFPPVADGSPLHFGTVIASSNGFAAGQGAVLFPELLALRRSLRTQSFGVVFLDRLTALYASKIVPALSRMGVETDPAALPAARRLAFLAHEWGHLSGPTRYDDSVVVRRRRLVAVIGELCADLAALVMLLAAGTPRARDAAGVLVFDRIVREAWLPRARRQVDSIAGRQLLVLLTGTAYARDLDLCRVEELLRGQLAVLRAAEKAAVRGDTGPARGYLAGYGWRLAAGAYHVELRGDLVERIRTARG